MSLSHTIIRHARRRARRGAQHRRGERAHTHLTRHPLVEPQLACRQRLRQPQPRRGGALAPERRHQLRCPRARARARARARGSAARARARALGSLRPCSSNLQGRARISSQTSDALFRSDTQGSASRTTHLRALQVLRAAKQQHTHLRGGAHLRCPERRDLDILAHLAATVKQWQRPGARELKQKQQLPLVVMARLDYGG